MKKQKDKKDDEAVILETALDFEEKCEAEFKKIKFGQREPLEKDKDNFKTLKRVLNRKLILLVKNPDTKEWHFPTAKWSKGESLRQVSEKKFQKYKQRLKFYFF